MSHMRIEPNDSPTELSYMELLHGLESDVASDEMMPDNVKHELAAVINKIRGIIAPYSA